MKAIKISLALLLFFFIPSCQKKLSELNIDRKDASNASGEMFFTYSMKAIADLMSTIDYSSTSTGDQSIVNVWRLYSQYYTQVQGGLENSKYFLTQSPAPFNVWNILYSDVLQNLEKSRDVIERNSTVSDPVVKENKIAIINIMKVYAFSILVETFGDIPYSEALNVDNVLPKYENQKDIYISLLDSLDDAILKLDNDAGSFGSSDPFYSGNVSQWKKFGNSVKLRMGMRIANVLPAKSAAIITEAINSGVMTSNEDSFIFKYLSTTPNTNLLWRSLVQSGQHYFIPSATLVDTMNKFNDPRRDIYFTRHLGGFVGGKYGLSISYNSVSHIGSYFKQPELPQIIFDYSSVEFFLAEAAERSFYGNPSIAETHYNKAIEASLQYYGIPEVDIQDYLNQNTVKYTTAQGPWQQKIGVQKWIAGYNQGVETWTEYRRLGYPVLVAPVDAFVDIVPVRFTYPIPEQTLNNKNYLEAAASIGGDLLITKLFWDVN